MAIFTDTPVRSSSLNEFQTPMSDVLAATAEEALLYSPLSSVTRAGELVKAQEGTPRGPLGIFGRNEPNTPMMAAEAARQRVADADLDLVIPDEGIREGALDILMERKREERRRQDIFARGPGGFAAGAARIGVSLGASLLDPLNVASAFIPVVGPARYSAMVARASGPAGRAGVRAGVGVVEGAVGAALVEPFVYSAARMEQADYTLADSLLNIGIGSILGGGLHVGAGAIGDAVGMGARRAAQPAGELPRILAEVDMQTREAALRVAVSQALTGRQVDVEPVLSQAFQTTSRPEAAGAATQNAPMPVTPTRDVEPTNIAIPADEIARLDLPTNREWRVSQNADGTVSVMARGRDGQWRPRRGSERIVTVPAGTADAVTVALSRADEGARTYRAVRIGEDAAETVSPSAGKRRAKKGDSRAMQDAAIANHQPTASRFATMHARAAPLPEDGRIATTVAATDSPTMTDITDVVEDATRAAETLGAADIVARELEPFDRLAETAAAYARAVDAAASCQLRRGR